MRLEIMRKTLRDARRAYLWWLFGVVTYVGFMAAVYPMVRDRSEEFQAMLEGYPDALLAVFGMDEILNIASGVGFLTSYYFGWLVPGLFLIYAISFCSRTTAGEEEAGTLDLLLATPVSRRRVIGEKFLAMTLLVLGLALVLGVAIVVSGEIVAMDVPVANTAAASLVGALLGLSAGSLTLAVAAATGRRGLSAGIGAAIAVGSYLFYTIGSLADRFAGLGKVSLLWLYFDPQPLQHGLSVGHSLGFVAIAAAGLLAAIWMFERHDIAV